MCWHTPGLCAVKHRCDGFSRPHMELLPSPPWTENADSAGRGCTYLLTHADDIIVTISVASNETPQFRAREREGDGGRPRAKETQRKVRKEEESDGGGGGWIRWPLGHSLEIHRDRAGSWVSRSHTCVSEIYCWVGLMTPSQCLTINWTGMENCVLFGAWATSKTREWGEERGEGGIADCVNLWCVFCSTIHTLSLHENDVECASAYE